MQTYLSKKDNEKVATDNMRSFRVRRLHDKNNKRFNINRKGGNVTIEENDINLGIHMNDLPPVKMDIYEINNQKQTITNKQGGMFEFDVNNIEHNPNRVIKKK